ncbi:MAG: hypothetical protein ACHQJ6_00845 [Candidatus Berkiellales bacterium]
MSGIDYEITLPSDQDLNYGQFAQIDEEGLLPGIAEARTTAGVLAVPIEAISHAQVQFVALADQTGLTDLNLTSKGVLLYYELSHDHKTLTAHAGEHGPVVFTTQIDPNGQYSFTLHSHIDRPTPVNLWHENESVNPTQNITTEPNAAYQLSFYYQPHLHADLGLQQIHTYWDNQLIHIINTNELTNKVCTFALEGNSNQDFTALKFVAIGDESALENYLHQVSLISTAQHHLPLPFKYVVSDNDILTQDHYTINVTTTPPIELHNQIPADIYYEQAVYQTIIVYDQNPSDNPLTTINLEHLFNNLAIHPENRLVSIVQLEENGQATNVYEVQISDKSQSHQPIAVADVQLSFPGGDGGLAVFQHNIAIDEGGHLATSLFA